ncbi:MAG: YdbH domain-containing protein [Alphaproteobacteria bacterium]|nr:YdbH domain-containing protein [Alphaproteobacteria bacterium]
MLLLIFAAVAIFASQFSLHGELEKRISAALAAQGLSDVKITIAELDERHILFSHISFAKDKIQLAADDVNITATALPVAELLRKNYANLSAEWSVKSLVVSGLPQELPSFSGEGKLRGDEISGTLHDAGRRYESSFIINPVKAVLHNIRLPWEGAVVSAKEVAFSFGEPKPIHIPLRIEKLPLTTLLAMISSDKASGTGTVSGNTELIIFPDGNFSLGNGTFTAGKDGLIQLSPEVLPGDAPQMEIARQALANFHYKDLRLTLSPDKRGKVSIRLNLEGNNPDALGGRPVKLNINLSGDVLELLQQTIMPMADPTRLIEKDTR